MNIPKITKTKQEKIELVKSFMKQANSYVYLYNCELDCNLFYNDSSIDNIRYSANNYNLEQIYTHMTPYIVADEDLVELEEKILNSITESAKTEIHEKILTLKFCKALSPLQISQLLGLNRIDILCQTALKNFANYFVEHYPEYFVEEETIFEKTLKNIERHKSPEALRNSKQAAKIYFEHKDLYPRQLSELMWLVSNHCQIEYSQVTKMDEETGEILEEKINSFYSAEYSTRIFCATDMAHKMRISNVLTDQSSAFLNKFERMCRINAAMLTIQEIDEALTYEHNKLIDELDELDIQEELRESFSSPVFSVIESVALYKNKNIRGTNEFAVLSMMLFGINFTKKKL